MARLVLRLRLVGGEQIDVSYDDDETESAQELLERVIGTLSSDSGVLQTRHGDRLLVIFGRGVAGFELSPRGAVL